MNFALSITNASTTQCVNITITDDTLIEDVENFVVSITGVTGLTSNASVDITDVATVNIADNDRKFVFISIVHLNSSNSLSVLSS